MVTVPFSFVSLTVTLKLAAKTFSPNFTQKSQQTVDFAENQTNRLRVRALPSTTK